MKNISIHFTLKGQSLDTIQTALSNYITDNPGKIDFAESRLHHCFLSRKQVEEKGFETYLVDYLDQLSRQQVNWSQTVSTFTDSRIAMLSNLRQLNGTAIFIGALKEGVLDEFNICTDLGINIVHIPLVKP